MERKEWVNGNFIPKQCEEGYNTKKITIKNEEATFVTNQKLFNEEVIKFLQYLDSSYLLKDKINILKELNKKIK